MYAVIRAGGKQYRVAPGDVVQVERHAAGGPTLEFELLAVGDNGTISRPEGDARVIGQVMGEGRGKKILVFHFKSKKQYKKMAGHRQPFTAVRIAEITYDGHTVRAPELPAPTPKKKASTSAAAPGEAAGESAARPRAKKASSTTRSHRKSKTSAKRRK